MEFNTMDIITMDIKLKQLYKDKIKDLSHVMPSSIAKHILNQHDDKQEIYDYVVKCLPEDERTKFINNYKSILYVPVLIIKYLLEMINRNFKSTIKRNIGIAIYTVILYCNSKVLYLNNKFRTTVEQKLRTFINEQDKDRPSEWVFFHNKLFGKGGVFNTLPTVPSIEKGRCVHQQGIKRCCEILSYSMCERHRKRRKIVMQD